MRHRQDGAVVLGDEPAPVLLARGVGQVAVLVEDGGERGHLLVEGEVGQAGEGTVDPPPPPLLEQGVDLRAVGPAEIAEQLGGEIAVALRVERLGRRRQRVGVGRTAARGWPPPPCRVPAARPPPGGTAACGWPPAVSPRACATSLAPSGPLRLSRLRMARRVVGRVSSGVSVMARSDGRRRTRATGSPRRGRRRRRLRAGVGRRSPPAWPDGTPRARAIRSGSRRWSGPGGPG